ncbi:MAG: 4-hydroxybenzoate polyprenyltransferase [Chthonomonadaceae bacterium]|nr:4-hydroxybenzoate polyprenyltransferase [Chthonomonadaceae bacterium]
MNAFLTRSRLLLDMIKFEHTIFALPFALISFLLAIRHTPGGFNGFTLFWIVVAMVGARSAAMAFNRLVDADYDAQNPRTAKRHIPAGLLSRAQVTLFLIVAVVLFEIAAWRLNRLCLLLSPVALAAILGYSYTKRFTALCHLFLGFAIGIAPIGAWIAVRGTLDVVPILLGAVVMLWIGGFDIIYALQDYDFDRESALFSLPKALGKANALNVSRLMHTLAVALLVVIGRLENLHLLYFAGVIVVAGLILYEQSLVKPDDLSRVDLAFFTLNGWVSVSLFAFVLLDSLLLH